RHFAAGLSERPASPSLVPLHNREVFFPRGEERKRPRIRDIAGPAVHKQQRGIVAVLPANRDPLFDSANRDVAGLVNAIWRRNRVIFRVAIPDKGLQLFKLAVLGVKGGGCGGRLLCILRSLPPRP